MPGADIRESEAANAGVEFVDSDGKTYVYLYVASACTAKTPYAWYKTDSSNRPLQSAVPAAAAICKIVVATETLAATAAAYSKFVVKGLVEDMICPSITYVQSDTLIIDTNAVAAGGEATITPEAFAIVQSAGATAAVVDCILLGREITPV